MWDGKAKQWMLMPMLSGGDAKRQFYAITASNAKTSLLP